MNQMNLETKFLNRHFLYKDSVTQHIDWQKVNHLLPVIVQSHVDHQVLMLGYMNVEALHKTLDTGLVTFFSRTRQRLWTKGENSGHTLELVSLKLDCDRDSLLVFAKAVGPTCHTGEKSCFLEDVLYDRNQKKDR